ncbi:MAG TPA: VanZ family protein [Rhizomicrobium sp.]|jgi:VanZ family protein
MRASQFDRNRILIAAALCALIVHGSLYPYAFVSMHRYPGPIATLLGSWNVPPTSLGDLVANVVLYVPLGLSCVLALGLRRRLLLTTLFGFALCTAIEIAQFYDQGRVTNMSDVYLNTLGTWLGGLAGLAFESRSRALIPYRLRIGPIPAMLLLAMLGYRLFPYVPVIDLHKYWSSVKPIVLHPDFESLQILRYFSLWLTNFWLVSTFAGARHSRLLIPAVMVGFLFGARILIAGLYLTAPELVGALAAIVLWFFLPFGSRLSAVIVAATLCTTVILIRLAPFDFALAAHPFGWIPLRSLLSGSAAIDVVSVLEKMFLYGSLIWTAAEAGMGLRTATGIVAALLLACSIAETHLPGRSSEITDAIMALLLGMGFTAMSPSSQGAGSTIAAPQPEA